MSVLFRNAAIIAWLVPFGVSCDDGKGSDTTDTVEADTDTDSDTDTDTDADADTDTDTDTDADVDPGDIDDDGDGYTENEGDCDDTDESVYPEAEEICDDEVDNDCDDAVDELCALWGEMSLADADAKLIGEEAGDAAGGALCIGDVNGDGLGDLVVTAPGNPGGDDRGAAYIVFSPVSGTVDLADANAKLTGENDTDHAGASCAAADIDGDGYADLLVGAPDAWIEDKKQDNGAAYLVHGPTTGTTSLADSTAKLAGESWYDSVGRAVAFADLTGDGIMDLVVRSSKDPGGTIHVLSSTVTGALELDGDELATVTGESSGDGAGIYLTTADMNGDGVSDLILGAWGADHVGELSGAAYVLLGPITGEHDLSEAQGRYLGEGEKAFAGHGVAAGDIDGDGTPDLLVGAYGEDEAGERAGAAYVVQGPATSWASLADAQAKLVGQYGSDRAGDVAAGDLDGDGVEDLVVGAPGVDVGGATTGGAAYAVLGEVAGVISLSSADAVLFAEDSSNAAGGAVVVGDVDSDGLDELLVGAVGESTGGSSAGAAYLILGGSWQ